MSRRSLANVGAVLLGVAGGTQVLAGMSQNLPWQVSLMIVTASLGAFGAWLSSSPVPPIPSPPILIEIAIVKCFKKNASRIHLAAY